MKLVMATKHNSSADITQSVVFRFVNYLLPAILLAISIMTYNHAQAAAIDLETRTELQLALKNYIDAGTVDGVYEHFNAKEGQIEKLRLKTLHPVIFAYESKYMMCADFLDAAGNNVLIDYIVGSSASGFRIEQVIPGRRSLLQQIFERIY